MAITVTKLNKYIKTLVETDLMLNHVSIEGEISNLKIHSSGHYYLTLKDDSSAIRAVMFKGFTANLKFRPENGMKVIATGKVSVYERDGQYQLYITTMQPDGLGDLHVAYEQLKTKLQSEGLFDQVHKKPIPKFPKTVGVITSPTGAAIKDIINVAKRRFPMVEILVCPVLVQGEGSSRQIVSAIEYMNNNKMADVLIVGRGGGSIEDLWSFNEESVAYAIYNSDIPVISAVGHETDFTIADFVADLRAPTPSAAAELAVPSAIEIIANINTYNTRILNSVKRYIDYKRSIVSGFSLKNPMDYINQNRLRTDNAIHKMSLVSTEILSNNRLRSVNNIEKITNLVQKNLSDKSKQVAVSVAKLDTLSPLKVMTRGYSVTQYKGNVINSVDMLKANDEVLVKFVDGTIDCTINNVNKE